MAGSVSSLSDGRIAYLEELVRQARTATAIFTQYTQEDVDRIVKAMVLAGLEQAQYLARLAIQETKLGVLEDKAIKNMVATEFLYNYVRDKRTVGAIREYPDRGLVEVTEPIGVIFSLTPITNPTPTVLFKCIMALKTRNAVIFGPHPKAFLPALESPALQDNAYLMDPETGFMQPMAVGQKATDIAGLIGLQVKPNTKLLIAPIQGVSREHPLSVENLFPVPAVYRAKSVDEALRVCVDVNHAGGLGHTAVIFSCNDEIIRKFAM
jgi:acyl-CoA reductase-like NAD-dependent aldehyde dehydrogenase